MGEKKLLRQQVNFNHLRKNLAKKYTFICVPQDFSNTFLPLDKILIEGGVSWNTPACWLNPYCRKYLRLAHQLSLLNSYNLRGLGSLLQYFAEFTFGGSFHPNEITLENHFLVEPLTKEETNFFNLKPLFHQSGVKNNREGLYCYK